MNNTFNQQHLTDINNLYTHQQAILCDNNTRICGKFPSQDDYELHMKDDGSIVEIIEWKIVNDDNGLDYEYEYNDYVDWTEYMHKQTNTI